MFQRIRRRDLILLSGLFSFACFILIAVAMLILANQAGGGDEATVAGPTSTPGPEPTHTVTFVQATGLNQYPLAETAAQAWAADAQLISANADWPQVLGMGQVGEPTRWTYRFYSPAKKRLFFVVVESDDQIQTIEHVVKVTLPPRPIKGDSWLIDSPAALAIWLDYGGSKMLQTNPGLELAIQLRTISNTPNPVWMVVGLDDRTQDMLVVVIDANEGLVKTVSPES